MYIINVRDGNKYNISRIHLYSVEFHLKLN